MSVINRNGKTFDDGDVQIAMFGSMLFDVTEISYSKKQEHQENFSLGSNEATSYSTGKVKKTASMTLRLSSASAVEKAVGGNLLLVKPFPVIITFVNDDNDIIVDKLMVKFSDQGRDVTGGMDLKMKFELFPTSIDFNVV